ncbi:MAG: alpha-galactosidase [Candidatus Dormibacteria bacterium]
MLAIGITVCAGNAAGQRVVTARAASTGDALASIDGSTALLSSSLVRRTWHLPALGMPGVATTALTDPIAGRQWASSSGNDLTLDLGGVKLSSASLALTAVTATTVAGDPRIPGAPTGARLAFRYSPLNPATGVELERDYTTYPGSALIEVDSRIRNTTALAVRVSSFTLDELTSPAPITAHLQRYVGGSDWRDDFRQDSTASGAFDSEGEVLRMDDGTGSGFFFVAERRGGDMSRVGRDATGRAWTGVDYQRDLFDYGPLMTSPPDYNRLANPAYPAGGRERTLQPLSAMRLGRAYIGVYHGGAQEAARNFVESFTRHDMPNYPRTVGLNSFHPWNHGPGMTDLNLRTQANTGRQLGLESFMLDDQWQGQSSGDWNFTPSRFPDSLHNGTPDFVRYLRGTGINFGLWMSPVEFNMSSQTATAHPDWVCTPIGQVTKFIQDQAGLGVWDVTNPAFRAYFANVVDRAVVRWGVREFKFDFQAWLDCGTHDYLDYEDAFVDMVRGFQQKNPAVTFELDETNDQRAWPFESAAIGPSWFDNGHTSGEGLPAHLTYVSKELHDLWSAAPWLPASSIGFGLYDDYLKPPYTARYLMPLALLSHFTFWTDLTKLSPAEAAETRWWITWFEQHRDSIPRFSYEDTAGDPADGSSWLALQPWAADAGYLVVFRQGGAPATQPIALQGVTAGHLYSLTDVRTGTILGRFTGSALRGGLPLTLPSAYSSMVLAVTPVNPACPAVCPVTTGLPLTAR